MSMAHPHWLAKTCKLTMSPLTSPWSQRGDDAVRAEAVQTLFGRHGVLQHVQTDGTHQLAVQRARRHGHLRPIHDRLLNTYTHTFIIPVRTITVLLLPHTHTHTYLRAPVKLIQTQFPGLTGSLDVYWSCHDDRVSQSSLDRERKRWYFMLFLVYWS